MYGAGNGVAQSHDRHTCCLAFRQTTDSRACPNFVLVFHTIRAKSDDVFMLLAGRPVSLIPSTEPSAGTIKEFIPPSEGGLPVGRLMSWLVPL